MEIAMMTTVMAVSMVASMLMTGLVWFVQVVHYPLFAQVGRKDFVTYAALHSRLTSIVVMPLMLVELATAVILLINPPALLTGPAALLQFGLVLFVWISTFAVQVPLHRRLGQGFDKDTVSRLVSTNWVRTALWSARSLLLLIALL